MQNIQRANPPDELGRLCTEGLSRALTRTLLGLHFGDPIGQAFFLAIAPQARDSVNEIAPAIQGRVLAAARRRPLPLDCRRWRFRLPADMVKHAIETLLCSGELIADGEFVRLAESQKRDAR
jgi:hypothetical protein